MKLSEIPEEILPFINNKCMSRKNRVCAFINKEEIQEVFTFCGRYRINTKKGQYRVDDAEIEIY